MANVVQQAKIEVRPSLARRPNEQVNVVPRRIVGDEALHVRPLERLLCLGGLNSEAQHLYASKVSRWKYERRIVN